MDKRAVPGLVLASASPRRLELLAQLGLKPQVRPLDLPEVREVGETPLQYSRRVAMAKAAAGFDACARDPACLALGADTEVVIDGDVLGKPADAASALAMLKRLRGRSHQVLSSVALVGADFRDVRTSISTVRFGHPDDASLKAYVDSGEAFGRAGAYAIQGRAAAFIESLEGSYSGVVGLPLYETAAMLREAGVVGAFLKQEST